MALGLTQTVTAVAVNIPASFLATGGTAPYVYSIVPGGAGGSINASTGAYVAPSFISANPVQAYDTIKVTDSLAATATAQILIGTPLILFCDIIQSEMNLANGRVYLWDQKIMQPTDSDLYIAVSVMSCKPFGNSYRSSTNGLNAEQFVSMYATIDIDIISRGPAARDRKEEIILALQSTYARQQQDANSFYIGKLSTNFINLSNVDGAAIPYRYKISVAMQYAVSKISTVDYFDTFTDIEYVNN